MALLSVLAHAQQSAPPTLQAPPPSSAASGTVSGRVLCSDSQRPARFAQVMLIPVEEANNNGRDREDGGRRTSARTDLDGMFTATNVAPGDYYATATATGYVSESALMVAAGTDVATALAHLPSVHVSGGVPSTVNISLERGSVIAGRIQWDDGSPAAGVQVNVINATTTPAQGSSNRGFGGFFGGFGGDFAQTDDRGQFRLTGLAPGSYFVRASVQAPVPADTSGRGGYTRSTNISMYAPGKVRKTDAQTVTVRAGEERNDVTVIMDLNALHRITGHVGAASGTVASGTVRLVDAQDTSLSRAASIASDGSYMLTYVPSGTYSLSVPYASSVASSSSHGRDDDRSSRTASTFQPFQETLSVADGDLTAVDVTLNPATQSSSQ